MLFLFLVSGHVYMCVRNIDVIAVPCEWSCIYVSGISMLSLFLVTGHVYVCQKYRCCLCSLSVVMYMSVRNIDVVSVPCEWSCIYVSGISMLSLFLVSGHVYICLSGISMLSLFLVSGHVYVCQEYRCCLCSL